MFALRTQTVAKFLKRSAPNKKLVFSLRYCRSWREGFCLSRPEASPIFIRAQSAARRDNFAPTAHRAQSIFGRGRSALRFALCVLCASVVKSVLSALCPLRLALNH
jgi:hypothetical protein